MLPHEAASIVGSRFIDDSSLIFHYSSASFSLPIRVYTPPSSLQFRARSHFRKGLSLFGLFFRDNVVFRMTWSNSANKKANIHSVAKTVDIKNMSLNIIKKSVNIRVVQLCRFPNRQTSQEWSICLFRPSQYALKYRDFLAKKYPKRSRYILILQSHVPP